MNDVPNEQIQYERDVPKSAWSAQDNQDDGTNVESQYLRLYCWFRRLYPYIRQEIAVWYLGIRQDSLTGQSVAINKPYGRDDDDDVTVLIVAPAFVYTFQQSTNSWTLQSKLTANDASLSSEDRD